jgi:hypothetical protein
MIAPRGGILNHLAKGLTKRSWINGCPRVSWILKHISIGEGLPRHSDQIESRVNLALSVTRIHDTLQQPNGGADTPLRPNALIRQIRRDLLGTGLGSGADRLAPVKLRCNLRRS